MADDAWTSLAEPVRRFMSKRVRDAHLAEDLAQDVMLKVRAALVASAAAGDDRGPHDEDVDLAAWVFRIARNTLTDYYRSPRSRDAAPGGRAMEPIDAGGADESQAMRELAGCLRPMLARLAEPYRQAVQLTEFEGVSQVALAERLGISVSGAKSRVQRGRQQLKAMLLDCCQVETDAGGGVMGCDRTARSDQYCRDESEK